MKHSKITEEVLLLLSNLKTISCDDVKSALDYVLNDYEIKKKEKVLAVADNDLKITAIKNFFIAKKS